MFVTFLVTLTNNVDPDEMLHAGSSLFVKVPVSCIQRVNPYALKSA